MQLLGIRFCAISEQAKEEVAFFEKLGLSNGFRSNDEVQGGVFANQSGDSWVEVWQAMEQMPEGMMLQLFVDNADEMAEQAKANGLSPHGPQDAHGERIYFLQSPSGIQLSFQSKIPE